MTHHDLEIRSLSLLTPGNYLDDDPYGGLEDTLQLFEFGEREGFNGAWIRQRHLEHGVSAGAVFLAAASQRTTIIELGTAVIPIAYETPFRLAEDLALADVLSRGRLQIGLSAGTPQHIELIGDLVFDGDWRTYDFGYGRIDRLIGHLSGEFIGTEDTVIHSPGNVQRPRVQPYSKGLTDRLWYGGGSLRSANWAGQRGVNFLAGNVVSGEGTDDFVTAQLAHIQAYRAAQEGGRQGRVAVGRVIVPFDSADRATRAKYREYAASRYERTLTAHGERRTLFARDVVGTAEQILDQLSRDAAVAQTTELRLELPYEFVRQEYEQILYDIAHLIAPNLGWRPVAGSGANESVVS